MSPHFSKKIALRAASTNHPSLRILFNNTNEHGICMLDSEGKILSWNMSAERLTGYSANEIIGKSYSILYAKDSDRTKKFLKTLATAAKKERCIAEGVRIRKDGSQFWGRSFITLVRGERGDKNFFVLIVQDTTSAKELELKRDEYIDIASHELKNPITTLSLYSDLLADRLQLSRDKKNLMMLRDIQGQASRLTSLVDDLLVVSKIEGGQLELHKELFNPLDLIKQIVKDFRVSTHSHRIVVTGTFTSRVNADRPRIAQVLINLLSNAVKYSPKAKKVVVHITRKKQTCIISVQDFGGGIPKQDQIDIFARFFRVRSSEAQNIPGTGLGLYISKAIIKKHRGRLAVKSTVGKGTTFSFTLSISK